MNKTTWCYNLIRSMAITSGDCCLIQGIVRYLSEDLNFDVTLVKKTNPSPTFPLGSVDVKSDLPL